MHTIQCFHPGNKLKTKKICNSASVWEFCNNHWTGMDWNYSYYYTASIESGCLLSIQVLWQDSSTTMEHASSRIQSYISKQLHRILEAPGMLHSYSLKRSLNMCIPFDLSLAVQTCRAWLYGETDRSYGLMTSCCLASVAWLNLYSQSS